MKLPQPGDIIGDNYRLEEELGRGGFATVYRGVDELADRAVAVKVLTPSTSGYGRDLVARFEQEVIVLAQLNDPHTVRLFDYGQTDDGVLFMVFEFVEGKDLSELLKDRKTVLSQDVQHIVTQVLQSLSEAHALGLLHRDIKPENIRVFRHRTDPLRVKVLDFGIARQANKGDAPQITQAGHLVGTPRYMSPEQLRFTDDLTPASDIYSLGVVAYEMLMGSEAMHGYRLTDQVERVATPEVFALPTAIDPRLREVIGRMLHPDLSHRFGSAAEVLDALATGVGRAPQAVSDYVAPQHAAPIDEATTKRYRRVSVGMLAGGLLLLVALAVVWFAQEEEPTKEPVRPRQSVNTLLKGDDSPAEVEPTPTPPVDMGAAIDVAIPEAAKPLVWTPPPGRLSPGCGRSDVATGSEDIFGKNSKDFISWSREQYDPNTPHAVIILGHATHETPVEMRNNSGFDNMVDDHDVVLIAPRANAWKQAMTPEEGIWDPADARRIPPLLAKAGEHLCLDLGRVFAVGQGDGGDIIEALPCVLPTLRGIATVSFRPKSALACPDVPVPYLHFSAKLDGNLPRDGDGCAGRVMPLDVYERVWRVRNGCDVAEVQKESANGVPCTTWSCVAPFVSCEHEGGRGFTNSKPRTPGLAYYGDLHSCDGPRPTRDLSAEIWTFFESLSAPSPSE